MIIVSLNIRGVRGGIKAKYLKNLILKEGVEMACLQETKTTLFSNARCFALWGNNEVGWIHNDGVGGAGSLLVMWYKQFFVYERHVEGSGFIAIFGQHVNSRLKCAVVNVYAACNMSDKKKLWEELSSVKNTNPGWAWCFCGDFNAVRSAGERKGVGERGSQKSEIKGFNSFIESNLLVELPLVGKKFTWFKANGTSKSRLDRVLVSDEWLQKWPMGKQYIQPREVSDHCAIVVKCVSKDWGPRPFRSLDAWLMDPGFKDLVKALWNSYTVQGDHITVLKDKLKILKCDLKEWNRDVFGHLITERKRVLFEIDNLDNQDDGTEFEDQGRMKRLDLIGQLNVLNKKTESLYRQKARTSWSKYGDANTKFYHATLRWRRMKNEVKGVHVGDQWCEEPEVVRREAKRLFEERFAAKHDFGVRLDNVQFKKLYVEESVSIISIATKEEIKEAVWSCEGSKSPGPDGYNFNFVKHNWEVLKQDIIAAVHLFQASRCLPKGSNASFIALVPKVRDPTSLEQFRPISLVGMLYKIIAKVLSCRMKKVLPLVVDECQAAFLRDRELLDSVLVAN